MRTRIFEDLGHDLNFLWAFLYCAANVSYGLSIALEIYPTISVVFISDDSIEPVNRGHLSKLKVAAHTLWVFVYEDAKVFEILDLVFFLLIYDLIV